MEIHRILKKYYIGFSEKFDRLLTCEDDEEIRKVFGKLWGKEHGGLFRLGAPYNPPEILPRRIRLKGGAAAILITDTGSPSAAFHKEYVKALNRLILEGTGDPDLLSLDFRGCSGGKPQVMAAGLLPLFGCGTLSYYWTGLPDSPGKHSDRSQANPRRHRDIVAKEGAVICHSNNSATATATKKKMSYRRIEVYFDGRTASAAEQMIICLLKKSEVRLIGKKSAGLTTVNKYFEVGSYGLEVPIGYMGTYHQAFPHGLTGRAV